MKVAKISTTKSEKLRVAQTEQPVKKLSAVDKKIMQMRATLKENPFPFEEIKRNN
ncbi:hypothetical protein [Dyadobacter aurulentus]|uniref:hypothetical protein n=1 Tax=Dyadobacter sp. UC 10 TaxID=2605428 RepID=UPI001788C265|nr:hypothetical protein [Dyadobacter sp. UC 10]